MEPDLNESLGIPVASGIYFVMMDAGGYEKTQKIVMSKLRTPAHYYYTDHNPVFLSEIIIFQKLY